MNPLSPPLSMSRHQNASHYFSRTGTLHKMLLPQIDDSNIDYRRIPNQAQQRIISNQNQSEISAVDENDDDDFTSTLKSKISKIIIEQNKNKSQYERLCRELHSIYVDNEGEQNKNENEINPNNKSLSTLIALAQTLYILANYFLEQSQIKTAHKFIILSLLHWRCANVSVKKMGIRTKSFVIPSHSNLDEDDFGYFWPQIVSVYILCGDIFAKNSDFGHSDLMYRTALDLCHCVEGKNHFCCLNALEHLMNSMIAQQQIDAGIVCIEQIIKIQSLEQNAVILNEDKVIETKALYACLLQLSKKENKMKKGGHLKTEVLNECIAKFGAASTQFLSIFVYFIKHSIHSLLFEETDKMIVYLSNTFCSQRPLKYFEEYAICQLFEEYLSVICGLSAMNSKDMRQRLNFLYLLHMKHIDNLNKNPLTKQHKINKAKVQKIYAHSFEKYGDVETASLLRQMCQQQLVFPPSESQSVLLNHSAR